MASGIKLGATLYSLSESFYTRRLDLDGCVRTLKEVGCTGLTIVAAQSACEYPFISDKWLFEFRDIMQKHGIEPVCWEGYLDVGMRSDRDMNPAERLEYTINDMVYAKKAGFSMMKTQHSIGPEMFESLLPTCEKLGVKVCIEMHYPHHPHVPVWERYFEIMERSNGWLGACPDMSIFQRYPHQLHINQAKDAGFRADMLQKVLDMVDKKLPIEEALALGLTPVEEKFTHEFYHKFASPTDVAELAPMLKYSHMIHGKFYYLGEDEHDPCIPYESIMPILCKNGYNGYLLGEYEGHHFYTGVDEKEQLRRFIAMCNKYAKN